MRKERLKQWIENINGMISMKIPDRTKCCFMCKHVFTEDEIRWTSPVMETLCDSCHTNYLSVPFTVTKEFELMTIKLNQLKEKHDMNEERKT